LRAKAKGGIGEINDRKTEAHERTMRFENRSFLTEFVLGYRPEVPIRVLEERQVAHPPAAVRAIRAIREETITPVGVLPRAPIVELERICCGGSHGSSSA
jgi:hypothetical protein